MGRIGLVLLSGALLCGCGELQIEDAVPEAYTADVCNDCEDLPGILSGDEGAFTLLGAAPVEDKPVILRPDGAKPKP